MSDTPIHILAAVRVFIERKEREPLLELFRRGFPLHAYPESRDLVEKLLREEAIWKQGQKSAAYYHALEARNDAIQSAVAQLVGAGRGAYAGGESTKPTACSIVKNWYDLTEKQVYRIYQDAEDSPRVALYRQLGKENAEQILEGLRITGDIK